MPSLAAERVSSPNEAFFPPTRGMSARERVSNQQTLAESGRGDGGGLCTGVEELGMEESGMEELGGTDARAGARVLAFMGMEIVCLRQRFRQNGTIRPFCLQPECPGLDDLSVLGYVGGGRKVLEK